MYRAVFVKESSCNSWNDHSGVTFPQTGLAALPAGAHSAPHSSGLPASEGTTAACARLSFPLAPSVAIYVILDCLGETIAGRQLVVQNTAPPCRNSPGGREESTPVCVEDVGVGCVWQGSTLADLFAKKKPVNDNKPFRNRNCRTSSGSSTS